MFRYQLVNRNIINMSNTMKMNYHKACELFDLCQQDFNNCFPDLPNPQQWLLDQKNMRMFWEIYKAKCDTVKLFNDILLNNHFAKYMDFMYNTYASNFTNMILSYIEQRGYTKASFLPFISGLNNEVIKYIYNF